MPGSYNDLKCVQTKQHNFKLHDTIADRAEKTQTDSQLQFRKSKPKSQQLIELHLVVF